MLRSQPHVFAAKLALRSPTSSSPYLHQLESERAMTHHWGFEGKMNSFWLVQSFSWPLEVRMVILSGWSWPNWSSYMMAKKVVTKTIISHAPKEVLQRNSPFQFQVLGLRKCCSGFWNKNLPIESCIQHPDKQFNSPMGVLVSLKAEGNWEAMRIRISVIAKLDTHENSYVDCIIL